MSELEKESAPKPASFPMASIREARETAKIMRSSRLWWLTVLSLVIAFWLTWTSIPQNGPTVRIHFPDGHGLKTGDSVRHRGIEVGKVVSVALNDDLTRITATVVLTPGGSGLAREGTRFWIVRPQLSLTEISGLETAVGAKYIAVSPGDPGPARQEFDGLATAPPDPGSNEGIDIVLRSDSLHGASTGAPVTWRGVDVGRILSAGLSPDARFVDIHVRIDGEYRRLLRPSSRFWVTSGLGVDVGLSGFKLNADSLSTILRGGISFTTPTIDETQTEVRPGSMFVLHEKPDPEWLKAATSIALVDFALPPTITLQGSRRTSTLGIPRTQKFTAQGLLISTGSHWELLTSSDLIPPVDPAATKENAEATTSDESAATLPATITLAVTVPGHESSVNVVTAGVQSSSGEVKAIRIPIQTLPEELPTTSASIRTVTDPEDCCVCRSVISEGRISSVIQCFAQDELHHAENRPGFWTPTSEIGDLTAWHGAPVISMKDGRIIGVLVVSDSGPGISILQ